MKALKRKISEYQSGQKVRRLWGDYCDAKNAEGGEERVAPPGTGQAGRALRAFVDAVDLMDAKQPAMLESLADSGQGDLVATLLELAEVLVGVGDATVSPPPSEIALAGKALGVVEACLAEESLQRRSLETGDPVGTVLRMLGWEPAEAGVGIGAVGFKEGKSSIDGSGDVNFNTVKEACLRLLCVIARDEEGSLDVGHRQGFQTVSRLVLAKHTGLQAQAVATINHFLASTVSDLPLAPGVGTTVGEGGRWASLGLRSRLSARGSKTESTGLSKDAVA
ncbi:unnamed protein product, partial [Choristocarpus tenellus]